MSVLRIMRMRRNDRINYIFCLYRFIYLNAIGWYRGQNGNKGGHWVSRRNKRKHRPNIVLRCSPGTNRQIEIDREWHCLVTKPPSASFHFSWQILGLRLVFEYPTLIYQPHSMGFAELGNRRVRGWTADWGWLFDDTIYLCALSLGTTSKPHRPPVGVFVSYR